MPSSVPRSLLVVVAVATAIGAGIGAIGPAVSASAATVRPASSSATPGGVGIRLVDIPVDTANDPRARQYIVDQLIPGSTVHRRIEVSNSTSSPLRVAVYADAASITNGSFIGAAGHSVNELSTWTTLTRDNLDIPAGAVAGDTVTIAIPMDAPPGEQYATVWAEVASTGTGNISLVSRAGIRMYVAVGGNNPLASGFTVNTMTAQRDSDGRAVVQAQVHNTGGRALDMSGTLRLSQVVGSVSAGPYPAQLGTSLAPGQSEAVKIVLIDQVADGPWNATIELQSGLVHETYQAQITFPHNPGIAPATAVHPAPGNGQPTILRYVLLGAVVLLVIVLFTVRRRRRNTNQTPETQARSQ